MIDAVEVLALLDRAVAEKGEDYVYEDQYGPADSDRFDACQYFIDDAPACIAGHVFSYVGLTPGQVTEASPASEALDDSDCGLFSEAALGILDTAQCKQDFGWTWGQAVSYAKSAAGGRSIVFETL